MSLHWKNAEIMSKQAHLLGRLFDWFADLQLCQPDERKRWLKEIGETLDFDDKYIQESIDRVKRV